MAEDWIRFEVPAEDWEYLVRRGIDPVAAAKDAMERHIRRLRAEDAGSAAAAKND